MDELINTIKINLERVAERINTAAISVGRDPKTVRLVVVTKGHSIGTVRAAIEAGARTLGENYVEEALEKMAPLETSIGVEWHMIGHIQSRKARIVCQRFDYVHSVDSEKLAGRLDRFCAENGSRLPVLLECNVSGESSKFGFSAWNEVQWQAVCEQVERIAGLKHLDLRGLMTMAPYFDDPQQARPYFQRLVCLRDYLSRNLPQVRLSELSMGMSGDFEAAVQEGATIVRIGTAILGARPT